MNRATKRLLAKQQAAQDRQPRRTPPVAPGRAPGETRKRTPPRQFLKEVRNELKKVAWPTRGEVATYTLVVLVSVTVVTFIVFGLDYVFARSVLKVFAR